MVSVVLELLRAFLHAQNARTRKYIYGVLSELLLGCHCVIITSLQCSLRQWSFYYVLFMLVLWPWYVHATLSKTKLSSCYVVITLFGCLPRAGQVYSMFTEFSINTGLNSSHHHICFSHGYEHRQSTTSQATCSASKTTGSTWCSLATGERLLALAAAWLLLESFDVVCLNSKLYTYSKNENALRGTQYL